jgi:hypothetical protein
MMFKRLELQNCKLLLHFLVSDPAVHFTLRCRYSRTTGLSYNIKGLRSPPNITRGSYNTSRRRGRIVANLGAGANLTQLAQAACGKVDVTDPNCAEVLLLLLLTPAAYSANSTADTPGRRAYISPAQVILRLSQSCTLQVTSPRHQQQGFGLLEPMLLCVN